MSAPQREEVPGQRCGADDEIRTRDIDLGKVALYQLSYIRAPEPEGLPTGRGYPTRETGSIGASVGRLGEMLSPDDLPVRRR